MQIKKPQPELYSFWGEVAPAWVAGRSKVVQQRGEDHSGCGAGGTSLASSACGAAGASSLALEASDWTSPWGASTAPCSPPMTVSPQQGAGAVSQQTGFASQQAGLASQQTGSGVQQTGSGVQQTGSGVQHEAA